MSDDSSREKIQGLLLSDDLLFNSRITGTAEKHGLVISTARNAGALRTLAQAKSPRCIIVDLSLAGKGLRDFVRSLRAVEGGPTYLVGYGSHVDTAGLQAARDAGFDLVLPRSKFVEAIATRMPEWFASGAGGSESD